MAVSTTTFEERLARINGGQTVDVAAKVGRTATHRPFRARMLTFPFMVGVGILTGGAAYALAYTPTEITWVLALAG